MRRLSPTILLGLALALAATLPGHAAHRHHRRPTAAAPASKPFENLFPAHRSVLTQHPESGSHRFILE